jgi:DNA-binding transcriptional MerR regulator
LSIGRFARLSGLSIGALRHYGELGLLVPADVSAESGYRFYTHDQLETARLILRLRDLDMPLPEIGAVLTAGPRERRQRIDRHRARMEARTFRLQRIVHQLTEEMPMTAPVDEILEPDTHRSMAAALFNHAWTLLEAESRDAAQDDEMIHAAHASRWHWSRTGVDDLPQRLAVGEWQCSRVYCVLGRAEPALHHAQRCLALAEQDGVEDWVYAAACETMARAYRVAGDKAAFDEWRERATAATAAIKDAGDREVIEGDLATL